MTHHEHANGYHPASLARRVVRAVVPILSVTLAAMLIVAASLLAISPGQPRPFLDGEGNPLKGSISEKTFVGINGTRQGMFIKGRDVHNPVLLYLHGGMPDYFLTQSFPTGLEDYFTVVWWEQRGSGLSYSDTLSRETLTVEQMLSDTKAMSLYLRERFGQDKIYLMGHSGGTFIGIQAAARWPELYKAYLGVAQMTFQLKSEKLAYEYMLSRFARNGNSAMVRKLESAPVTLEDGVPAGYLALRDNAMHALGIGTMHDMQSVVTGIFFPSLMCRDYTLWEKVNLWSGKSHSGVSALWDTMLATNLAKLVPELQIPVYFFHGVFDYTVSYPLARDYFEKLKAPLKGFYTFQESAHSPMFEEPERNCQILKEDVLTGKNSLADKH